MAVLSPGILSATGAACMQHVLPSVPLLGLSAQKSHLSTGGAIQAPRATALWAGGHRVTATCAEDPEALRCECAQTPAGEHCSGVGTRHVLTPNSAGHQLSALEHGCGVESLGYDHACATKPQATAWQLLGWNTANVYGSCLMPGAAVFSMA
eukprot:353200-Chlamydomonas_euryale.AAC.10